jgi:hypothetical protein
VTVRVVEASGVDAIVNLTTSAFACATGNLTNLACVDGSDIGTGTTETVTYSNRTAAQIYVFAVVEAFSNSSNTGTFTISATLGDPPAPLPPGDTCANAVEITNTNLGFYEGTTVGTNADYGTGTNCPSSSGRDAVYSVMVPAQKRLSVAISGTHSAFEPIVSLGLDAACTNTNRVCLIGSDAGGALDVKVVTWANTSESPRKVYLFVDGSSSTATGGGYEMIVDMIDLVPGDVCENAIAITTTGTITANTNGFAADYHAGTSARVRPA